jgi:hypothetical protein
VVELFDPVYDAANQTLKYNVTILEQPDLSYAVFNERADTTMPETFGPAALFIDDCADSYVNCAKGFDKLTLQCEDVCKKIPTGCCWHAEGLFCRACHDAKYYRDKCPKGDCANFRCDKCCW